ncbi:NAD-dependent epimerase/dehydratase family protein [Ralstonia solanacearum]|uniref:NAD-dependent epimerase/dehydratase family protein n=1 Tax=Ralstonia solanacearum TaxID=305 RepID=UPI000AF7E270|nr:NAD(P)-dependent oxidoreductase [Ralstonia solanacearum]
MAAFHPPARILVTGVAGNLGRKVVEALAGTPWCTSIIGVDWVEQSVQFSPQAAQRLRWVVADLTQADGAWTALLDEVDADPPGRHPLYARCDVEQALASYGMTLNVLQAAATRGVRRFVFASSNHAMGAYKDQPLASTIGPGKLVAELDPAPGTRWHNGIETVHSLAYGTSKAMGERLCKAVAARVGRPAVHRVAAHRLGAAGRQQPQRHQPFRHRRHAGARFGARRGQPHRAALVPQHVAVQR